MKKNKQQKNIIGVLALFLISPIVAEVLFGSTPFSRLANIIPMIFFYGSAAVLIREIARRTGMGWPGIIALALAFGVIEEAIVLQTVFNPNYFGTDISYGRAYGVNWVWSLFIIGYHSLWSIALPIAIVELSQPNKQRNPWLKNIGLGIVGTLFVLMSAFLYFIFQSESGYAVSAFGYLASTAVIAALIAAAFLLPRSSKATSSTSAPRPIVVGAVTFLAGISWLGLFSLLFENGRGIPGWGLMLLGGLIIACLAALSKKWKVNTWSNRHLYAISFGSILSSTLFGFNVLMAENNPIDLAAHGVFLLLVIGGMLLLRTRIDPKR